MKNYQQNQTLLFLHLPKVAGSTFIDILKRKTESKHTFTISDAVRKTYGQNWGQFSREDRENTALYFFKNSLSNTNCYPKMVLGHMKFGWHNFLSNDFSYIGLFREPVDRVISQYNYIKRLKNHYQKNEIFSQNLDLKGFIESGVSLDVDNGMTRRLAGIDDKVGFQMYDSDILEKAISNIDQYFSFVGVQEHFNESILTLSHVLGWKFTPLYIPKNVTKNRPKINNYDSNTQETILRTNSLDIKLYEYALSLFIEQKAQVENFDEKFKKYQTKLNFLSYTRSFLKQTKSLFFK